MSLDYFDSIIEHIQDFLNGTGSENIHYSDTSGIGKIGVAGFVLGWINSCCLILLIWCLLSGGSSVLIHWSCYLFSLSLFHFLEFFVTSFCQPSTLSYDSFVINHSKSYSIAAIFSWLEFWLEYLLLGNKKFYLSGVFYCGILLCVIGQAIRSMAMYHCGENFSHQIVHRKQESHQLVTSGIYRYLRHPSYFGWFYWSIGTQMLLSNPICFIGYFYVSWKFFRERIQYEEALLLKFFGQDYEQYRQRSMIGIPFI